MRCDYYQSSVHLHSGTWFDERSCCTLVRSLVKMLKLEYLNLDKDPSSCIRSMYWKQAGLDVPPDEIIRQNNWISVLKFLRAGPTEPVHELRLMFIGDGEVGKTSLVQAFRSENRKANRIPKERRTVGIDIDFKRPLQFPSKDAGPGITCQVCDFAGQEIYYLSHTLHFTRRCLYVLMWTTHKFSNDDAAKLLDIADIVGPLKRWLQLLATNVPDANVLVVGTHCRVDPTVFERMRSEIDEQVHEEIDRLRHVTSRQATATRQVFEQQQVTVNKFAECISQQLASMHIPAPQPNVADIETFLQKLPDAKLTFKSRIRHNAESLLQSVLMLENTKLRLGRLFGVHDGSIPSASAIAVCLKLVNRGSFAVDSVDGMGVTELLNAIEATCRDREALPFMGEKIPVSWLQVSAALQQQRVKDALGDSVILLTDATAKLGEALRSEQQDVGINAAQGLNTQSLKDCLEFWSHLGRVFVHDRHFLRDPCLIIELLKPLVHHNVLDLKYRQEFCHDESMDLDMEDLLDPLQQSAIVDHRLLSHLKSWPRSFAATKSMLHFFKQCFMISSLSHESLQDFSSSLVTARLCDPSNVKRQREVCSKAAVIEESSDFFAVYALPMNHIGIIARMQATIEKLRPPRIHLDVAFGSDCICVKRGSFQPRSISSAPPDPESHSCCVSVRSLDTKFSETKLGSLSTRVSAYFSHALVVSGNDDGLFAFAARCVDEIIRSCAFGSFFQSWLPCRTPNAVKEGASWVPAEKDWAQLSSVLNPTSLSEILCANANDVVFESHRRQLKDVLPRKPPIFMSHAFKGDGTGEFCIRLKKRIEDKLLCTVWLDKYEMGSADLCIKEMQTGMQNAHYFVICLTPVYLTRPNCLRELRWALDMCAAEESTKKILILPLHPAVSKKGCHRIIEAAGRPAHVFLPVNDSLQTDSNMPEQWRGHKLSKEAVTLLQRLTGHDAVDFQAGWLQLQPWLSDKLAHDWEEESLVWADEIAVTLDALLECCLSDMLNCITRLSSSSDFTFADFADDQLVSDPPSQDNVALSDASVIFDCYPRSRTLFSDQELVSLVRHGLSDVDIMACVEHGFGKFSVVGTQANGSEVVFPENRVDRAFRLAAHMSGVNFEAARKSWLENNQLYVGSDRRDPLLQKDPEHQNYCKVARMLEKVSAGIVPRIEKEMELLHALCLQRVMSQKPADDDEDTWKQSLVALEAWKSVLLQQHRNSNFCKASSMLHDVESGKIPKHEDDPKSLYAKCFVQVTSSKPAHIDEGTWQRSSELLLEAWKTVLSELLSSDKLTREVEIKQVFQNVPEVLQRVPDYSKLWSTEHGPHQIAKTFCAQGADRVQLIYELDSAKKFNILRYCKQFPDKFQLPAAAANTSRNKLAHLENSSPKMTDKDYRFVFDSMQTLLQCLDDPSRSLLLAEIQILDAKELQMVDVASVNKMQKETEYLRAHVAYLTAAGQTKKFSLQLRADHSLKVVPNIASVGSFTCKVRIVDAPAAVGDHVAGAAVDTGTRLFRATDSLDGYISKISVIDDTASADSKGALTIRPSASIGQDALVEVAVVKMDAFWFPGLQRDAERQKVLIASLKTFTESDGCKSGFKKIAGEVIGKLQKSLKLSDAEQRFWDAFGRSPEEALMLASPSFTPTSTADAKPGIFVFSTAAPASSRARGGPSDVAHSSDEKTPGSDVSTPEVALPAAPTSAPRSLPDLLQALGIGSWRPVSRQKAWAQLIPGKPDPLSPQEQVLFPDLGIDDLASAEQSKWVETERVKFAAARLTKEERKVIGKFALEPSQTVDDMLRVLEGHKNFRDVSKSFMPQQARFALVKTHEKELEAIFPLKGDREFLLQRLKEPAGKLPAAAVSESAAAVSAPAPVAAPASRTLAIPPSSPAMPAAALSIEAVVRGIGPAYDRYVQRFQDNGLHSLEDLSGMNAEALSDELIQMGITAIRLHANKMAQELVKARPS